MPVHPEKKRLPGDPDAPAKAADGEVLAVRQFIGLGLTDVQVRFDLSDSEILIFQDVVHFEILLMILEVLWIIFLV